METKDKSYNEDFKCKKLNDESPLLIQHKTILYGPIQENIVRNEEANTPLDDLDIYNSLKTKNAEHNITANEIELEKKHEVKIAAADGVKFEGVDENDSICSSDSDDDKLPPIPDGGWGWVVVTASFLVSACADGLAFSFGLLHEEFTNYFQATQSKTSLIGSLFIATPLLAGPIMSALVDRYGCRVMTITAGIVSSIGFLLASVSDSVEMLCITFGFIAGLAMGVLYVTSVVSVAFWFDKKRNLAVSLGSCGIGFGTLMYSPLTHHLLEIYDWRNTIILLAGTLLNVCVCGALMRDPEWLTMKQKKKKNLSKSARTSSATSVSSKSIGGESTLINSEELKSILKSGENPECILHTLATSIAKAEELDETTKMNSNKKYKKTHSAIHLPTFVQQNEKVPTEVVEKLVSNKRLYNILLENYPSLLTVRSRSELKLPTEEPAGNHVSEPVKMQMKFKLHKRKSLTKDDKTEVINTDVNAIKENKLTVSEEHIVYRNTKSNKEGRNTQIKKEWLIRQISTDRHYLRRVPIYRNTIVHRSALMNITPSKLRASSLPNIYRNSMWSMGSESDDEKEWFKRIWESCKNTFDFRMFTELHFLIFNLASIILSIWYIVPYFFLQSYMTANNTEGGPTMISIIGIASSIGIVALGWAGDQNWNNVTKMFSICLITCGISVALYPPFIKQYWALTIISALFGISFASMYACTPAILMELMPMDNFTVAYGLILLSQGIGHLVGPPIGGFLYDLTGCWDLTFYKGGAWLIISGLCVGIIPYTKNSRLCGTAPLLKETEEVEKQVKNSTNIIAV